MGFLGFPGAKIHQPTRLQDGPEDVPRYTVKHLPNSCGPKGISGYEIPRTNPSICPLNICVYIYIYIQLYIIIIYIHMHSKQIICCFQDFEHVSTLQPKSQRWYQTDPRYPNHRLAGNIDPSTRDTKPDKVKNVKANCALLTDGALFNILGSLNLPGYAQTGSKR